MKNVAWRVFTMATIVIKDTKTNKMVARATLLVPWGLEEALWAVSLN